MSNEIKPGGSTAMSNEIKPGDTVEVLITQGATPNPGMADGPAVVPARVLAVGDDWVSLAGYCVPRCHVNPAPQQVAHAVATWHSNCAKLRAEAQS